MKIENQNRIRNIDYNGSGAWPKLVHMSAQPVREYVLCLYLLSDERISYVQYV